MKIILLIIAALSFSIRAEIDLVTTPMGATIAGLNEMEHQGFSSAMIKGITTSTEKVTGLFKKD